MIKPIYLTLAIILLGKFSVFAQPRPTDDTRIDPRSAPPRDPRVDPRSAPPRRDPRGGSQKATPEELRERYGSPVDRRPDPRSAR